MGDQGADWRTHQTGAARATGADLDGGDSVGGDPGPRSVVQPVQTVPASLSDETAEELVGPEEGYPINGPGDLPSAWAAAASAHDPELARRRIVRIALKRNWADGLPADARTYIGDDAWRREVEESGSAGRSELADWAMSAGSDPTMNRTSDGVAEAYPDQIESDGMGGDRAVTDEAQTRTRGLGLGTGNPY